MLINEIVESKIWYKIIRITFYDAKRYVTKKIYIVLLLNNIKILIIDNSKSKERSKKPISIKIQNHF